MAKRWSVLILPYGLRTEHQGGTRLLKAVRRAGIELETPYGGKGEFKQCRVRVISGQASIRKDDAAFLPPEEIKDDYLLACQTPVVYELTLIIPVRD